MTTFARRVADLTGVPEARIERLAGGDLSEVLLVSRESGQHSVAKSGPAVAVEAAMLRTLASAGIVVPAVEAEHEGVLLLGHVPNDRIFSPGAWRDVGSQLARLHANLGPHYGWPADHAHGSVRLDNMEQGDWPDFWGRQRLISASALLDRPWRERVDRLAERLDHLLPVSPRAALLHGDLWSGNILVRDGGLAALIDPACYYGDAEVDLAMLTLFDTPPPSFWAAYGALEPGWQDRRHLYQLFPALVHLRLFGDRYAGLADRLLAAVGA